MTTKTLRKVIKKGRGRPTKATTERMQQVIKGITAGLPYDTSCALAGISYQTFRNWMTAGESVESGYFFDFFEEVKKAEAIAESIHIKNIKDAGKNGIWQADAWMLERRYPLKWGRQDKVKQEISGPEGQPIQTETKITSVDILKEYPHLFSSNDSNPEE